MKTINWTAIVAELQRHFPSARVTAEYPGVVHVAFSDGETERLYVAGNANRTWQADYYPTGSNDLAEGFTPEGTIDSRLSVTHTDPWLVALNLAAAISRKEVD